MGAAMPDHPARRARDLCRAGLGAILAFCLLIVFALPGIGPGGASAAPGRQGAFTFTPHVTQVGWTATPGATRLGTLGPGMSPVPLAPTPIPPSPTALTHEPDGGLSAPSCTSANEATVGYDFIGGSDPPLWTICFGGTTLVVRATSPETGDLLSAFRAAADLRAQAVAQHDDAERALTWADVGGAGGLVAFLGRWHSRGGYVLSDPSHAWDNILGVHRKRQKVFVVGRALFTIWPPYHPGW
jgi:hypothetical protein